MSQFALTLAGMVAEKLEQEETEMDTVRDEKMGQVSGCTVWKAKEG